ncbi:oxysterol-binding protein [Anaeramoeba flamelloides]|uniref:Oxysterol-binding protein n=1 Tax=Anaeramoeba flamelloides TaxID=1746091 RepID=A0ABQ8ZDX5_9EUKA|nr:oxysterol-binding protein [Anaeramoeba flamelloides]
MSTKTSKYRKKKQKIRMKNEKLEEKEQEKEFTETEKKFNELYPYLQKDKDFRYLRKFMQSRLNKSGGVRLLSKKEAKRQRVYCWQLIKTIGKEILEGKELTSISMPIGLFEPRSFLERLSDGFAYAPIYLERAYESTTPVERLKNVITFAVSCIHLSLTNSKPFNPILGETFQSNLSNGTTIFCEQTSHHPPASSYELIGPNNNYYYYGQQIWSASFRGNKIKCTQTGANTLEFKDGTTIVWDNPTISISGILMGDRITNFRGSIKFADKKNDLEAQVIFDPSQLGFFKGLVFSRKLPTHSVAGTIYKLSESKNKNKKIISTLSGTWLDQIYFDEKLYWDIDENIPERPMPIKNPLPSDSLFRKDRNALLKLNMKESGELKVKLEQKQRYDRKLRAKCEKLKKKKKKTKK